MKEYPYHINDPEFANALVDAFLEINKKNTNNSIPPQVDIPKAVEHSNGGSASTASSIGATPKAVERGGSASTASSTGATPKAVEHFNGGPASTVSSIEAIPYTPSDFPDARPGSSFNVLFSFKIFVTCSLLVMAKISLIRSFGI